MSKQQFFLNTLPEKTAKLVDLLVEKRPEFLEKFYLSGGTGLSLWIGHRESEDLDFFTRQPFSVVRVQKELEEIGKLEQTEVADGTINTYLNGVKLQLLEYHYELILPIREWQGMRLSSVEDIACTKLQTVGMRGSKKDFVDLFFLLQRFSIDELFDLMSKKYQEGGYSKTHILKSLVYFEDAEKQPMPRMHKQVSWEEVKDGMIRLVRGVRFEGV